MGIGAAVAAAAVGAAAAAGGSAASGASAKKAAKKALHAQYVQQTREAAEREKYSQMIQAERELSEDMLRASEQTALNVFGSLGQPGTYDQPSQYTGPLGLSGLSSPLGFGPTGGVLSGGRTVTKSGTITKETVGGRSWKKSLDWSVSDKVIDPDELTREIQATSGFRTVSKLVADAEQILNKQGPLWNEHKNDLIGSVYGSTAASKRDMDALVGAQIARKAGAARTGMDFVYRMDVQRKINQDQQNKLFGVRAYMNDWARNNAMATQNFAQSWVSNHAGIRETFTSALVNLRTFWSRTWPAHAASLSSADSHVMQQAIAINRDATIKANNDMIAGISNSVAGLASSIGGMSMGGAGGGMLAGGMSSTGSYYGTTPQVQLPGGGATYGMAIS